MIVCVCNNVNDSSVKASIDAGAASIEAICEVTGAGACCGKCQFKVNRVLQQHTPKAAEQYDIAKKVGYSR